ncbi:MAG: hypothetical protein K0S53_2513 [Bacteroidetes bacterium]|nr:hypothetical protein [Bacteroidota bacterium]
MQITGTDAVKKTRNIKDMDGIMMTTNKVTAGIVMIMILKIVIATGKKEEAMMKLCVKITTGLQEWAEDFLMGTAMMNATVRNITGMNAMKMIPGEVRVEGALNQGIEKNIAEVQGGETGLPVNIEMAIITEEITTMRTTEIHQTTDTEAGILAQWMDANNAEVRAQTVL